MSIRSIKKLTIEELNERLVNLCKPSEEDIKCGLLDEDDLDIFNLIDYIPSEDINVVFDFENFEIPLIGEDNKDNRIKFYNIDNKFNVALCMGGGDWEIPVWFFLYFDDNDNLRLYIPSNGNTYNKYTMTAYGSEESCKEGLENIWHEIPDVWKEEPLNTNNYNFSPYYLDTLKSFEIEPNIEAMLSEIKRVFKVKE